MLKKIKISCLPIAGIENPYQFLMMEGLKTNKNLEIHHGRKGQFFPFLRTIISNKPNFIHVDWLNQYYIRRNLVFTCIQFVVFVIDLFLASYILRTHFVWTLHNIKPHDTPYYGPYKWAQLLFAKRCDWIRVFSESSVDNAFKALKVKKEKIKVIAEGSYVNYYENITPPQYARKILGISEQSFVLLFLGSVRPYKGIEELIEKFNLHKKNNWKLIIAGLCQDSQYVDKLFSLIEAYPEIIFNNILVPSNELQNYYNASDIVVLPFQNIENSGSAILAMGFKKPVIAPAKGVLPFRLIAQPELLYLQQIDEVLSKLDTINSNTFQEWGYQNFLNTKKYKWEDFSFCFDTLSKSKKN